MKPRTLLWLPAIVALVGAGVSVAVMWPRRKPPNTKGRPGVEPAPAEGAALRAVVHLGRRVGRIETKRGERSLWLRTLLQLQRGRRKGLLHRELKATLRDDGSLATATLRTPSLSSTLQTNPAKTTLQIRFKSRKFLHKLDVGPPLHIEETAFAAFARGGLQRGRKDKFSLFDLEHGRIRRVTVEALGRRRWHGIDGTEVLITESLGTTWNAILDPNGVPLETNGPIPGVQTRRWNAADRHARLWAVDLGAWGRVMTSGDLPKTSPIDHLRLRLRGLPPKLRHRARIDVVAPRLDEKASVAAGHESELRPSPFIESTAPEIAALARKLAPKGSRPMAVVRGVTDWIRENIRQADAIGPPSALATLETRVGNCNEIAALSVGLLRAAGLPSRIAFGLAVQKGAFRYHAWPEVALRGGYFGFDPTLGQLPVDGTHVRLSAGGLEAQAIVLHLTGRLTVEILEGSEKVDR